MMESTAPDTRSVPAVERFCALAQMRLNRCEKCKRRLKEILNQVNAASDPVLTGGTYRLRSVCRTQYFQTASSDPLYTSHSFGQNLLRAFALVQAREDVRKVRQLHQRQRAFDGGTSDFFRFRWTVSSGIIWGRDAHLGMCRSERLPGSDPRTTVAPPRRRVHQRALCFFLSQTVGSTEKDERQMSQAPLERHSKRSYVTTTGWSCKPKHGR